MADAQALFRRHWAQFNKLTEEAAGEQYMAQARAFIYAASVVAEAIRHEQDDLGTELRIVTPPPFQNFPAISTTEGGQPAA